MPFAELTDARLYYELNGEGDPLILVPGLGADCRFWDTIADDLLKHFSLIRVDNRGLGQSVPKRRPTTLRDYSADLVELLDYLQIERAHMLGLSLGGTIAQRFAIDHPSRVSRLVLVSCADRFGPYLCEVASLVGQSLRWFPKKMFAQMMEILGGGPMYFDADPQRLERRLEEIGQANVRRSAVVRQLRCLTASDPDPQEYHISAPTLVIAGEYDTLIPHCYVRRMAEAIPDSRFMLIPDAGHNPFLECPQKVLPSIIEFLCHNNVSCGKHNGQSSKERDAA